jgi:outer membrane lipoprotein-sorting protein
MLIASANRRMMLLALAAMTAGGAIAAAPAPQAVSSPDEALVAKAVAYLEGLSNAKGRFVQVDARGSLSRGDIYLHRPGKVRFQYDPPIGMIIASDGRLVSVLDPRLKSFQNYPLRLTPLSLLLSKDVRLGKGAVVAGVASMPGGFAITVREGKGRTQGDITLVFSNSPVTLSGWTITDARGAATHVRLVDFGPVEALPASLFDLRNPYVAAPPP